MAKIRLPIQRPWIPYIILVVALTLTSLATYYVNVSTYERDRFRFLNAVQDTTNSIEIRLETYTSLLRGGAGFFAADPNLTQQQFSDYVNRLQLHKNYPGIGDIGFVEKIAKSEFVSYPVRFVVQLNQNQWSDVGYDLFSDPIRQKAMEEARDTGLPASSGKVVLVDKKNKKNQAGFLIFVPVYTIDTIPSTVAERRAAIRGFIFSIFSTNQLLTNLLENKTLPRLLTYQIYVDNTINNANLLLDSKTLIQKETNYTPRFQTSRRVTVAGNMWTINFTNHPEFDVASQKNLPPFIFIGGLLVSITFFLLSRSQYKSRTKAEITALELQLSQKELQKAIGIRDNFISIASHELKTPVTSLKVYTEVLLRQFKDKNDKKTSDYLIKILRQIDKLTILIQDLLDVSRIQTNQLSFHTEKIDVNILAKEVIETTQQIADHHRIILEGTVNKKVWGDRERISQVLVNLLTNALKYSPQAKQVIVTIQNGSKGALISVKDFGIGIRKEHQKKIFNRFYRINKINEQTYPGLGIGLFISQAIIKRHGSEISLISKKGKGSTFQFSLPYSKKEIFENA